MSLLIISLLCPNSTDKTRAADGNDSVTTLANVNVMPAISIAAESKIDLEITPKSTSSFSSSTTDLFISTNSPNGYSVYMTTTDGTSNLNYYDKTVNAVIGPTTKYSTKENFPANTWGYSLDSGEDKFYQPVTTSTDAGPIIEQTDISSSKHYDLTFGVNINTNIPAGQYSNLIMLSAVANPVVLSNLMDLTYMQQMNRDICENTISADKMNPTTKQLIDTRDGKKYWVAKLADGRCWMTQNLALDIKVNGDGTSNIRAADSNVDSDWTTIPAGGGWTKNTTNIQNSLAYDIYTNNDTTYYPPLETRFSTFDIGGSQASIITLSWDLGEYVVANPTSMESCGTDISSIETCTEKGILTNVQDKSPTFSASATSTISPDGSSYDPHYLIGNYYQWNTATAGTGGTIINEDAPNSICPKGWQLPTSGEDKGPGSLYGLFSQYGFFTTSDSTTGSNIGTMDSKTYYATYAPLYFVTSGRLRSGTMTDAVGNQGQYWSSTAYKNNGNAYYAQIDNTQLNAAAYASGARWLGHSVRCVNATDI